MSAWTLIWPPGQTSASRVVRWTLFGLLATSILGSTWESLHRKKRAERWRELTEIAQILPVTREADRRYSRRYSTTFHGGGSVSFQYLVDERWVFTIEYFDAGDGLDDRPQLYALEWERITLEPRRKIRQSQKRWLDLGEWLREEDWLSRARADSNSSPVPHAREFWDQSWPRSRHP